MPLRNSVRLWIIAASPIAAVFLNGVRLIPTVWLFGYADPSLAHTVHGITGWVVVALSFVMLCAIMRVLRRAMVPVTTYTLACD
jgi:exosortase/archaeosortase family protein